MQQKKKRIILLLVSVVILCSIILYTAWGNTALELNSYKISSDLIPSSFDGFRIAHVSDLHNMEFGKNNENLLFMLKEADPDMIAITGDLIDSRNTNIEIAFNFAEKAMEIAPCYYVNGNHEARISSYDDLRSGLLKLGVVVLENEKVEMKKSGEKITVAGMSDPNFLPKDLFDSSDEVIEDLLEDLSANESDFFVLLSHRPELFDAYAKNNFNLVLCGHAHGGQFRLPFLGGIAAPNQGLFPKYDSGKFYENRTNMIVNRGIGNSIIPFRFNNRPEVVLIELDCKTPH